jgi:hypothetical protein
MECISVQKEEHEDKREYALNGGSVKVIEKLKESNQIRGNYYLFTGGQR